MNSLLNLRPSQYCVDEGQRWEIEFLELLV